MSCLSVAIATASWPASRPPRSPSWPRATPIPAPHRSEEHTSELQSRLHLVCRLLLEKKKKSCKPFLVHHSFPYQLFQTQSIHAACQPNTLHNTNVVLQITLLNSYARISTHYNIR